MVREPSAAIASHVAVKPDASCSDIGYEHQYLLFELAWSRPAGAPVVIRSDLLVREPAEVVRAYCAAIGLPYLPEAIRWHAGDRPEWQRTRVARRRRQQRRLRDRRATYPDTVDNGHLRAYYDHHRPFYERLIEHAF